MPSWTDEQRDAIYKDNSNIIVSAGAGSGKTAVLTERVLEKVKRGISLKNLLILTFTNMAAKEMRERIESKLKKEGLTEELKNLPSADIVTFDAYALSLVKKYHYVLNVSKDIGIIEPTVIELQKRKILEEIFEDLYSSKDETFLSLIKEYFLKDDRELFSFILLVNSKLDLKSNKLEYLDNYLDLTFNDNKIEDDIALFRSELLKLITKIANYLENIDDQDYLNKLEEALNPLLNSKSYDEIKANLEVKLPIAKGVSDITKKYKDKITNTIKELKDLTVYTEEKEIKNSILITKNYIEVIIDIIKKLDSKVNEYKEKYDYYEYHDISNLAIKLVRENLSIRENIKNNLNEILIDEYQDTSDIEEEFISYIANNNVYMVGDIKQSIYRFRNANPYIFKNKYDKYSKNIDGIKIDLTKNFRSREEVVSNINLFFNRIMDDEIGGASYTESHQMIFGNNAYITDGFNNQNNNFSVYTYPADKIFKKEEIEAFIIASDIKNKIDNNYKVFDNKLNQNRNINYSDFAILISNSKNFELFKKILEYQNIPTSIVKTSNLVDSEIIMIIKNIIGLIIKIKEKVFDAEFKKLFISLGRSFLFNIPDNELFNYYAKGNFDDSSIYKITSNISDVADDIPLDKLIDIIIENYDFYNKLILIGNYHTNITIIEKLKEVTKNLIGLDYSIYEYYNYLEDIIKNNLKIEYQINDTNSNTVKIMTIHASKGLEFGLCYFAGLYSKFNISDAISKFSYDEKYGLIIPYKDKFIKNTIYHYLSYRSYVKENISEQIRLFYVAQTRAREKMIFLLPQNNKEKNNICTSIIDIDIRRKYNSFASILYSLEGIIKDNYNYIDLETLNLTKKYNLIKNNNYQKELHIIDKKIDVSEIAIDTKEDLNKAFSKKITRLVTKDKEHAMEYGKRIHEIFEMIDFNNPNYYLLSSKEREYVSNFINIINIKDANIYKEYEFIYDKDDTTYHGIIDLMLEYSSKIKIIDYKLKDITDEEYLKQLNGYKDYIFSIFHKPVEIYLYSVMENTLQKL